MESAAGVVRCALSEIERVWRMAEVTGFDMSKLSPGAEETAAVEAAAGFAVSIAKQIGPSDEDTGFDGDDLIAVLPELIRVPAVTSYLLDGAPDVAEIIRRSGRIAVGVERVLVYTETGG